MKWMSLMLLSCMLAMNCQNTADASGDLGNGNTPVADDLPAPADETAEISLNGVRHTLVHKYDCKGGTTGIGFAKVAFGEPTLFLHGVDLNATGNITIRSNTNPLAWHMDVDDVGGTWVTKAAGCSAAVVENTATTFALKAVACPIERASGEGTLSFRLRCTKGT